MLNKNDRAILINIAMQAESEGYNRYFMNGARQILNDLSSIHGCRELWGYLINASPVTYKLYLEFCLNGGIKETISYKV